MTEPDDRGSATIWVIAVALVVALLASAVALVASATLARHRAQAAADLAALAAALVVLDGEQAACGRAGMISERNGAHLVGCQLDTFDVVVTVEVVASVGSARASARAGPVEESNRYPGSVADG